MRTIVFIFLASIGLTSEVGAQWRKIADFIGTDHDLFRGSEPVTCVYFLDLPGPPRIGFVGTESELHKTTDGGRSWKSVWGNGGSYDRYYPSDIFFKDSMVGWFTVYNQAQSTDDACYRTTDGGEHWVKLMGPGFQRAATSVFYCAPTNRLLLSNDTAIRISTDYGDTWSITLRYMAFTFSFWSPLKGVIPVSPYPYTSGFWLTTSDGGVTWDSMVPQNVLGGEILAIPGTSSCFIATYGWNRLIQRSDDFGHTWRVIADLTADSSVYCTGIIRGDLSRLFIQTDSGMFVSVDEGVTWKKDDGPSYVTNFTNDRFYAAKGVTIAGMTYSDGFIKGGGLWEEDWPQSGVARSASKDTGVFVTENPFDKLTTLHFTLSEVSYTKVDVLDVLGREVAVVGTGHILDAGEHQLPVDLSGCTAGTYYLRISLGTGEVRTVKLVKK